VGEGRVGGGERARANSGNDQNDANILATNREGEKKWEKARKGE